MKILAVFTGGDKGIKEAIEGVRKIAEKNEVSVLMSRSGLRIIGEEQFRNLNLKEFIIDDGKQNPFKLADNNDLLLLAVTTTNTLSKIANLVADSLIPNLAIAFLRRRKKIVLCKDSTICCDIGVEPAEGLTKKVNELLKKTEELGIDVIEAKDILRYFKIDGKIYSQGGEMTKDIKITWGSAGKEIDPQEGSVKVGTSGKPVFEGKHLYPSYSTAGKIFAPCPAYKDGVECSACGLCVVRKEGDVRGIIAAGAGRITALHPEKISPDLAKYIDHTLLKPSATKEDIKRLCDEAKRFGFASVCVNPSWVSFCKKELMSSDVKVCTVVGFPLGATTPTTKALEAREAIMNGADEVDMVINIGALKSGDYQLVLDDIKAVREATKGKVLKVIIETALLTDAEKVKACQLAKMAGADFVKTSTGFGGGGATAKDVALMKEVVGPGVEVKASGGIRTKEQAEEMIKAGATRIGASASVQIITGGKGKEGY